MDAHNGTPYPRTNFSAGAKWIKNLTRDRLNNFNGGHFSDVNLSAVMFIHRIDNEEHVKLEVWSAPGLTKPTFEEAMEQTFKPAKKGMAFGPSWTNHWWKVRVTIPGYWQQYERVQFEFDPGCEAMIYTVDGLPLQGITGGYGGDRRVEYIIPPEAVQKGFHEFVIESSCNGMFGVPWNGDTIQPPDMNRYFTLASADLVVPNQQAWALFWDFVTLREIADTLPGNTPLQNKALSTANEIMNVFNKGDASDINRARKLAEEVFGEGWESKGAAIYDEGPKKSLVWGIGHCHIDTAWLWPYRVTQQKVARSWSTQVDLMERYPEHRFTCSSAQQYKWLEQLYPPLFDRVKEKVLDGKFHLVGGSWVENDSNMPSGEALVRQFLFGQRFFQSRFGIRCDTAWLPDSFGLTGALPQIIRGSGMKYFFTQKLNKFPHSTFNWVGIDGTQVLCHMTPVDTYTAQATTGDVNKAINNHKNLESSDTALLVFGNGDGGGGPLAKMLENLRRIRAVTNTHRELPPVSMGHSVDEFFEDLNESSKGGKTLPNWHGELYLEFHRGTYTSHGSIKKGNRHSEILLRDVEHASTLATLLCDKSSKFVYPKSRIDECWEKVLLNQCDGMVYDDAEKLYAEVRKDGDAMLDEAFSVLFPDSRPMTTATVSNIQQLIAYNTTFFPRQQVVKVPFNRSKGVRAHVYTNGSDHFVLRNAFIQLTISKGRITSLLDLKLGRELITEGQTGGLVIFEDRPNYWDAWDVEIHHLETATPLAFSKVSVVEYGPLRGTVKAQVQYGKSSIDVTGNTATLKPQSRSMFVFDAVVDWHQRHEFLKFELPLNIHNDNATYETQFGFVQRPTHKNTTWDMAKFEVCGHKVFGYGVALLSESKYGFSCTGNILRISLLRAATAPDAEQDQGKHEFSWAVLPHEGHFLESDVPVAAYLFNSPLYLRFVEHSISPLNYPKSPFILEGARNVVLETIKRGEDDAYSATKGKKSVTTIILRLYEAFGGHANAQLRIASHIPVAKAYLTNFLEDEQSGLHLHSTDHASQSDTFVKLDFRGFEIKTVKLVIDTSEDAK
ncbi:glycoside hydrolase family 38 protein [Pleurotus ostreatus PC15]|uniref:alpha-mannosidase n=1 Tax=Pleurotus ostreatus (strain PC15) TaxID=1137138 RepID=A0A067NLS2_PLEO1|nr:glycoside hydrolase family 38 protein [Pleurotus ostreatus PC15]